MKIPFIYQKLLDKINKKPEITSSEFKIGLSLFRLTKHDWYQIAREMEKQGLIKFNDYGITNFNHRKIKIMPKKV